MHRFPQAAETEGAVSLEQEIIRLKPQKRKIQGGRREKVVVFCAQRGREGGVVDEGSQKGV